MAMEETIDEPSLSFMKVYCVSDYILDLYTTTTSTHNNNNSYITDN